MENGKPFFHQIVKIEKKQMIFTAFVIRRFGGLIGDPFFKKIFRFSLYGDLSGILGGEFSEKSSKNIFHFTTCWRIESRFSTETRKILIFSLFIPWLENEMPFGPLLRKKDNFSLLTTWLEIFIGFGPLFEKKFINLSASHIQASVMEKIEGFSKNNFFPLLVGHENGKS
ncbi:MAG: hypothetical protein E7180_00885 [Erysipelotrichaceae bacterium]|nr:hypothetical protein [Erysipelotrichaceae bacterium]